jgi:hypothetical protein
MNAVELCTASNAVKKANFRSQLATQNSGQYLCCVELIIGEKRVNYRMFLDKFNSVSFLMDQIYSQKFQLSLTNLYEKAFGRLSLHFSGDIMTLLLKNLQ